MNNKLLITIIFSLIICGCENFLGNDSAKLQIGFKNNSGHHLENLFVANKLIGSIPAGDSTHYFPFETFWFDTGMPDEDARAEMNGKVATNYFRNYWCGTEKFKAEKGKYLIEITISDTLLYLSCKNSPTIFNP